MTRLRKEKTPTTQEEESELEPTIPQIQDEVDEIKKIEDVTELKKKTEETDQKMISAIYDEDDDEDLLIADKAEEGDIKLFQMKEDSSDEEPEQDKVKDPDFDADKEQALPDDNLNRQMVESIQRDAQNKKKERPVKDRMEAKMRPKRGNIDTTFLVVNPNSNLRTMSTT